MEVEVITTKRKLTKSLISQMPYANDIVIKKGLVLGHVSNVIKGHGMIALIKYDEEYYYTDLNWKKKEDHVWRYRYSITFDNPKELDEWWASYEKMRKSAVKTHIYI